MTTDNISARLEKLKAEASTGFKMQIMKIYSSAEHPAFIPDSMVSEAVRVAEESASQFLRKTVSGASAISEAPEAFLLVRDAVAAHLLDLERMIEQGRGVPLPPATLKVINERFAVVSQRTYKNLGELPFLFLWFKKQRWTPARKGRGRRVDSPHCSRQPAGWPSNRARQPSAD